VPLGGIGDFSVKQKRAKAVSEAVTSKVFARHSERLNFEGRELNVAYHGREIDVGWEEMEQIIDLTDNVLVELYRDPANALRASLGTSGADKTELLSKSLLRVRRQLTDLVMEQSTQGMEFDDSVSVEMKQAITSYMNRIRKYIDNESMWSIQEDRVVMQFESSMLVNYQIIGVLGGLLLPAVQAARESARQMQSSNNLKQIMHAMHNYHDANGKFPAQAIAQGDGNPLLSWRVAILPYLGEQALYNQFHLDEPWDSEHNIALLEQMPEFFRNPSNPPSAGMTTYLVPMGKGVGLSSEGLKLQEITDGTSNTLAVLDVDPQLGVPWTKPDDLDIRQNEVLDWLRAEGSNAGFFDGSVRIIDLETDTEVIYYAKKYIKQGWEVYSIDKGAKITLTYSCE
jgi:prepilin-type processing-associated H-X9-DG protein